MFKVATLALASALAFASCTTDVTTSATSQEVTASTVTVQLWDPDKDNNPDAFWDRGLGATPAPVASMQYFIQKGDAGGTLTRGYPTVYVWLISDANHVHKVWRVAKDQYAEFINDMRAKHGAILAANPGRQVGGTGTPDGGDLGHPPHIGPHGDGTTFFSTDIVNAAVGLSSQIKTVWTNPGGTGFADIAAGEQSGT